MYLARVNKNTIVYKFILAESGRKLANSFIKLFVRYAFAPLNRDRKLVTNPILFSVILSSVSIYLVLTCLKII